MDTTDLKILAILEKNSRASYTEISKLVNLSVPSVIERINKLIDRKIIKKSTIELDYKAFKRNIEAIICIDVNQSKFEQFMDFCKDNTYIHNFYRVVGPFNAIISISVEDTDSLEKLVDRIKDFGTSSTCIITKSSFKNPMVQNILDSLDDDCNFYD